MSIISEKDMKNVERRIGFVANHINPSTNGSNSVSCSSIKMNNPSMNDSYHRVHGEVPIHEVVWRTACDDLGIEFTDIIYEKYVGEGIAKITINRPERRNAFRPHTVKELISAFNYARDDSTIGVIIFTGKGTQAFCSGGAQALRGKDGYADYDNFGRLNVLDLQVQIRRLPKPVIAMVAGYAVGGGHVLHMIHAGWKLRRRLWKFHHGSFVYQVGPKKARETWFLARFYDVSEAEKTRLVNVVVPVSLPSITQGAIVFFSVSL
ncbi:hypothetical protein MKX01_033478 [Papaver californicum]|nr:hypothetical protein MKX01_033478 [Papaver californicum]